MLLSTNTIFMCLYILFSKCFHSGKDCYILYITMFFDSIYDWQPALNTCLNKAQVKNCLLSKLHFDTGTIHNLQVLY